MSMAAALTLPTPAWPVIDRSELTRLEGLGDNCELGILLRRIGFEDGMLFRWASMPPQFLLATLRADFKDIYEFDNLVPARVDMVRDLHYGTGWHTQLYSSMQEGTLGFIDDEASRRRTHAREAPKIAYLIDKLHRKFDHPNPVFVIKSHLSIPGRLLEDIHYQLYRRVASPRFLLLEVCVDPSRSGTVELRDRNHMRGYLTRLSPSAEVDDADVPDWLSVLQKALGHYAEPPESRAASVAEAARELTLPFPVGSGPDLLAPVPGDLRGGMPSLIGGNGWCRMIEDAYRLHATGQGAQATSLRWTGVHFPSNCTVTVGAWCAIPESLPVHATLEIVSADGTTLRAQHLFTRIVEQKFSLTTTPNFANPLTVSLYVEPSGPLPPGERAVIDVDPIQVVPAKISRSL